MKEEGMICNIMGRPTAIADIKLNEQKKEINKRFKGCGANQK